MRCSHTTKSLLLAILILTMGMAPGVPAVSADASSPTDMQAQNIAVSFDPLAESTSIMWENINTQNLTIAQNLQSSRYLIYRSATEMNQSVIENGSIPYIANVSACTGNVVSCPGQQHAVTHPLPPGVNGSYFYGIATQLDDGTIIAFMELGQAHISEPVYEFTHDITAPFSVNATFFPETGKTKVDWINLNQLQPGTLLETGDNAYISKVYRHLSPATRASWPELDKELVAMKPAGESTATYTVPPNTDVDAYYSVTYLYLNYEDTRFIGGVNTMAEDFPVAEDNVAPDGVEGVQASFEAEPNGGTGNTTVTWADLTAEPGAIYHVWRSGAAFSNTTNPDVEHIATVQSGVSNYRYQVERGTLGAAYYAVTTADARGNHNTSFLPTSLAGPIMENAFDPWVAEPTNVQAEYIGGAQTRVTWVDQLGAEGEFYHVWHAWTKLSAASNLSLEATLVATVPDGVQEAIVPVPADKDRLSYYCITSVTRYNHLNATYEDTRFQQNCIPLPVREDTLAPAPVMMAEPVLHGGQRTVYISWINTIAEDNETYSVWRHHGSPLPGGEAGNISDDEGWELILDNYEAHSAETTILREVYLDTDLNQETWYALTVADVWGNTRDAVTNRSNAWLVYEDTTSPDAYITINPLGGEEMEGGALKSGDYRLHIYSNEPLFEFPEISVATDDYNSENGTGLTFTPEGEITRATPFLSSSTHFIWDFAIPDSIETADLTVDSLLIDNSGNSLTSKVSNWSIDANAPRIEIFSPSSESTYLYGDNIRIHGVASDDVDLVQVKYRLIEFRGFYNFEYEWALVADVTPSDAPPATLVFDMDEPSATFTTPGNHKLEIEATDVAGNVKTFTMSFYVDNCYENISGITFCESGNDPINSGEPEAEEPPGLTSPPYVIIIAVGAFNLLLLFFTILMGVLAAQDPSKKKKSDDDEFDEEDDWMLEFMGGASGGSGDSADSALAELEGVTRKTETKTLEDEDDPFATDSSTKKKRRQKKKVVEEDDDEFDDEDDDDFDDEDDDEFDDEDDEDDWGDDDEDDEPKKKKKRRRRPSSKKKTVKRRAVRRKK